MRPTEQIDERLRLAMMHGEVLRLLEDDTDNGSCVEACWLCYSCFESRVRRTLDKVSPRCCCAQCSVPNNRVGIATRVDCLKRLSRLDYAGLGVIPIELLNKIKSWCKRRNQLTHGLLTLETYPTAGQAFRELSLSGVDLTEQMYSCVSEFRDHYYQLESLPEFPARAEDKCSLVKRQWKNEGLQANQAGATSFTLGRE